MILDSGLLFGPPCRLDRFWTNQELYVWLQKFITGIGNRSSVDNFDDTIFSFIIILWICNKRQNEVSVFRRATWSLANYSREQFAGIIRVSVKRP